MKLRSLLKHKKELNSEVLSAEDIMELETIFDDFEREVEKAEFQRDAMREDGINV